MKAPLYTKKGNKKGEVVLNPEIYGTPVNERLLALVRTAYAANLRRGTASTKTRKEVRGGGAKPWKQKGTGRARHGSRRSPIWTGGGRVFGPHPRDYTVHLPKNIRLKALVSALSEKAGKKDLVLVEDLVLETAKTREWIEILKALPVKDARTVCIVKEIGANLERAARNTRGLIELRKAAEVSAYDLLEHPKLLIEQNALEVLEKRVESVLEPKEEKQEAEARS
ncbi:MAG: 50S ribosomal protein L4 [Candidatus Omnitrophota bacterium]